MSEVCRFYLRGDCKFGKWCRSSHVGRSPAPSRGGPRSELISGHPYYVPLPKDISGARAAGKGRVNFRRIEEGLLPRVVQLVLEPDLGKVS